MSPDREVEKAKGKKRKADEEEELDEGSIKRKKEVSNKLSIQYIKHTNDCIGGGKDHHSHGGPLQAVHGHTGHMLQEDAGAWLLVVQSAQVEVQLGCALGDQKEQRMERRRVGGSATTSDSDCQRGGDGLLKRLVGALERGVEVLEEMEYCYRRMEIEMYDEKGTESEEDEEEDMEEGAEEATGADTELKMGMEIVEKV